VAEEGEGMSFGHSFGHLRDSYTVATIGSKPTASSFLTCPVSLCKSPSQAHSIRVCSKSDTLVFRTIPQFYIAFLGGFGH
jgi:hypothetical protein